MAYIYTKGDLVRRNSIGLYRVAKRAIKTGEKITKRGKFVRYATKNPSHGRKGAVYDYAWVDFRIDGYPHWKRMKVALEYIEPQNTRAIARLSRATKWAAKLAQLYGDKNAVQ